MGGRGCGPLMRGRVFRLLARPLLQRSTGSLTKIEFTA